MPASVLSVRVDTNVKESFADLCEELGMTASVAVNMFMRQMLREKALPFVPAIAATKEVTAGERMEGVLSRSEIITAVDGVMRERSEIERVTLFGSYARGEATTQSDVDLRVEFVEGAVLGLFAMSGLAGKLETSLGKQVDIVTAEKLDDDLADSIRREGIVIYERTKN